MIIQSIVSDQIPPYCMIMYRHPPQSSNQTPSFPADLKDDNVQLREENQALKDYIDHLLIGIISTTPEILEVKQGTSARGSRSVGSFVE